MLVFISCLVVWGGVAPLRSCIKRYEKTKIAFFIQPPKFLAKFFALLLNHEALTLYVLRFMFYVMRRSLHSLKFARFAVQKKGKARGGRERKKPEDLRGQGFGLLVYVWFRVFAVYIIRYI
jgi:hypothetical protein